MTFNANGKCIGRTYKINNVLDSAMLDSLLWDVLDMLVRDPYCAKMTWEAFNLPNLPPQMDAAELARIAERDRRAAEHTDYARRVARQD